MKLLEIPCSSVYVVNMPREANLPTYIAYHEMNGILKESLSTNMLSFVHIWPYKGIIIL